MTPLGRSRLCKLIVNHVVRCMIWYMVSVAANSRVCISKHSSIARHVTVGGIGGLGHRAKTLQQGESSQSIRSRPANSAVAIRFLRILELLCCIRRTAIGLLFVNKSGNPKLSLVSECFLKYKIWAHNYRSFPRVTSNMRYAGISLHNSSTGKRMRNPCITRHRAHADLAGIALASRSWRG